MPASYSRLIARVLQLNERELPLLLRSTQLTLRQFLREDLLISAQQQVQIIENALLLAKDQEFGLQLCKQLTPAAHGAMGFLANSSPDFLTALQGFETYAPTRTNFTRVEVRVTETSSAKGGIKHLECSHHVDIEASNAIKRCMAEAAAMSFFECAKFIIGREIDEAVTYFSHDKPEYWQRYEQYLPGKFYFNSPTTFVSIPLALCLIPNVSANHENYQLAMRQCESMLQALHTERDTCQYRVQRIMLSSPPGQLSEENLAAELFISKRTLARRLRQEGTSYRQLRDELLAQQAAQYLNDNQLSVEAIAALLGYHDSANFRRAFKRWFGMPPDKFRKSQAK
jgi:AraC-like DNA-binding protein